MNIFRFVHFYNKNALKFLTIAIFFIFTQPSYALEKAKVQLKWLHHFQFAGYYAALEKGFYREVGLDVTILEGGPTSEVEDDVATGKADFGVGTSALLLNLAKGQELVVLGQVFQHSPAIFLTPRKTGIRSVGEMRGRRFMYSNQHGDMRALLKKYGISEDQIIKVSHNGDPHDLINGKADIMLAYNFNEPFAMEQAGEPYFTFSPLSSGIDFYGDNFFTSRKLANEHSGFVEAFRKATLQGWRYALDHKAEIADLILSKYSKEKSREWLLFEANQLENLIQPNLVELGYQSPSRWKQISATFSDLGMLPNDFDSTPIIYSPKSTNYYRLLITAILISIVIIGVLGWFVFSFHRLNSKLKEHIKERNLAEEALRVSEQKYRLLAENSVAAIWTVNLEGSFTYMSSAVEKLFGYTVDEVMEIQMPGIVLKEDYENLMMILSAELAKPKEERLISYSQQIRCKRKDGNLLDAEINVTWLKDNQGNIVGLQGSTSDITQRVHIENTLQQKERYQRSLLDNFPFAVWLKDTESRFLTVNTGFVRTFGAKKVDELIGKNDFDIAPRDMAEGFRADDREVMDSRKKKNVEEQILTEGKRKWFETYKAPVIDESGELLGTVGFSRDITQSKLDEDALRESEEKYRSVLENIDEMYFELDLKGNITFFNDSTCSISGYSPSEAMCMNYRQYTSPETAKQLKALFSNIYLSGDNSSISDFDFINKDRSINSLELSAKLLKNPAGEAVGFRCIARDITQRKQVEEALRESEERYRTLIENASDIIFKTDATGHFTFVNQAGSRIAGYEEKEVIGKEYWALVRPDMRDDAIKFFGRQFVKGLQNTYSEYPIITKDGREIWLGQNTSLLFEDGHVVGFQAMARDITDRKRTEKQLEDTLERLRKAFGATVQVMASAVEARDPYTAGHQIRSANLSRAIAVEMGLSPEKIEGIRISGSIHDIGKLSIPAEILSKPTKLSELEFALIKEHARRGFEMLTNVESPWPLAEIVHQHHERMDGSGYPRNLKGEEICIEARILTVADVVEAMASHRPYRPGLGIDAALNEIEKNRGIFYDSNVADACLRLFREKGFKIEGT